RLLLLLLVQLTESLPTETRFIPKQIGKHQLRKVTPLLQSLVSASQPSLLPLLLLCQVQDAELCNVLGDLIIAVSEVISKLRRMACSVLEPCAPLSFAFDISIPPSLSLRCSSPRFLSLASGSLRSSISPPTPSSPASPSPFLAAMTAEKA